MPKVDDHRTPDITAIADMPSEIKLDLHDIYNRSDAIERALGAAFAEAQRTKAKSIQIIPGKGCGQLKKAVHRFLQRPDIKPLVHRVDNDAKNWGRLFVFLR